MKIHFIGIGGVGMAALAILRKNRGDEVSGCDLYLGPRIDWLKAQGIAVEIGHDPKHINEQDEVVVTPAVNVDNPEFVAAKVQGRVRYRGEALAEIVGSGDAIAVCGSHGKTTTSTYIAKLLIALGENVEWAIGGETGDFPVAGITTPAKPAVLVVEADESDGSLALYHSRTLVITNCEYDHPDHFKTEEAYFACYDKAKAQAQLVIESERLASIPELTAVIAKLAPHNQKNARAAVEVALSRGHNLPEILKALPGVIATLPDRRFERVTDNVYTDYAHHPTEMKCAIAMARERCKGTLRVIFQPHRYSRTKALLAQFPAAFELSDEVILCPTYAAFERPLEGGDIADLYAECRSHLNCRLYLARTLEEAWYHAQHFMAKDDLTLLLGAGDIIKLKDLALNNTAAPIKRLFIGMGTNTWQSDLYTGEEYVETTGNAGRPGATLGIPWMAGIPGTIGGWIKMNAGAFGHSISEVLAAVKVDGEWWSVEKCGFGYRNSAITGEIQDYKLKPLHFTESADDYLKRRHQFPPGTKGSVFKNPSGDFAGRLLESVGAKELKVGGAYVWEEHANVIVAGPDATASDYLALAKLMWNRVKFRTGVTLACEVTGLF